jgi:plastocyanin
VPLAAGTVGSMTASGPAAGLSRTVAGLAAVVFVVVSAGACSNTVAGVNRRPHSGSASATLVNGVQQVMVQATDTYRFVPSTIVVHPGPVRIVLVNTGHGAPHNWSLTGFPADFVPLTTAGQMQAATFVAPAPGTYTFVCTIHVKQGQTGQLIVVPN